MTKIPMSFSAPNLFASIVYPFHLPAVTIYSTTRKLIHSPMDCRKAKYIFVYEQDVNLRSASEIYVK